MTCEELSSCKDELELQFLAKSLDKMDWFGSSDPFLQFSRSNEAGTFVGWFRFRICLTKLEDVFIEGLLTNSL